MPSSRIALLSLLVLICTGICAPADGPELEVRPDSLFFRQVGPTPPPAMRVMLSAEGGTLGPFTAVATTTSGGNWLAVSPAGGSGASTLTVSVNTAGLAAGEYSGRITITASGFSNSPRIVRVQLTIGTSGDGPASVLAARPDELEFEVVQGGPAPAARPVAIFAPAGANWTAAASIRSPAGGRWLRVSPASGSGNAVLQVEVDPAGLARGEYEGEVTVSSGSNRARVEVELEVREARPPGLRIEPRAFNFIIEPNATQPPAPKTLEVQNSGSGTFNWTAAATVSTPTGGRWLSISPTAGSGPGRITLRVDPTGLAPGMYSGKVTVTSGTSSEEAQVFLRVLGPERPSVQVTPRSLRFTTAGGVPSPASRTVEIRSRASGLRFTATASTARGGNWLRISPASGTVPGSFAASVDAATVAPLAPGVYTGAVEVRVPGAAQEVHNVHVALKIPGAGETARLEVEPGGLAFTAPRGGPNPAARRVKLEPEHAASIAWTAAATTASGGSWLSISPASGTTTAAANSEVSVSANVTGLAAGTYSGTVVFTPAAASGAPPVSVSVRLVVTAGTGSTGVEAPLASALAAGPLVALFTGPAQGFITQADLPLNVSVMVLDSAGLPVEGATVVVHSSNSEPELVLTDIGAGEYTGVFRALSSGRLTLTGSARVDLGTGEAAAFAVSGDMESAVESPVVVFQGGAVSAASFAASPTPLAPGSLVSLFGKGVARSRATASRIPLPLSLSGVSVTVGGIPAPLLAMALGNQDQINFQVPFELAGSVQADVVVNNNGALSASETITIAPAVPALFTLSQTGVGAGAVLHGDGFSPVTAGSPAAAGEVVLLYATGLGAVAADVATGSAASGEAAVLGNVSVTIGGQPARVQYAGLAPGFVGLYQINVVVPAGLRSGDALVVVSVDGTPATGRANLAIR